MIKFRKIISLTVLSVICLPFLVAMFHPMQRAAISQQTKAVLPSVPRNGLLGEWLFTVNAADTSGNGNNGSFVGDAAVTGGVLVLDGAGDWVTVGTIARGTGDFSWSMWVKTSASGGALFGQSGWPYGAYNIRIDSGHIGLGQITDTATAAWDPVNGTETFNNNSWRLVTFTRTGGAYKSYVDTTADINTTGKPAGNIDGGGAWPLKIGGCTTNTNYAFTGSMARVRFYDRVLTIDDVTAIYNAEIGEF